MPFVLSRGVARAALAVAACLAMLAAVPGPRGRAAALPLAVVTARLPLYHTAGPQRYLVALVDATGRVVASATAVAPSGLTIGRPGGIGGALTTPLPAVSISASRVYYLDGDALLRSLSPAGVRAAVTRLPGSATAHVAVAVSPDDRRLAVAVISYGVFTRQGALVANDAVPATTRLYTRDLAGGRQTTFFSEASSTAAEWPVGWFAGHVVLAVSAPGTQYAAANPYSAFYGYHVASAVTGQRLTSLCAAPPAMAGPPSAVGPLGPAGTLCLRGAAWYVDGWSGASHRLAGVVTTPYSQAALSPDGRTMAWSSAGAVVFQRAGGALVRTAAAGMPLGWLDATHLLVSAGVAGVNATTALLDLSTGRLRRLALPAAEFTMIGVLPAAL